MKFLTKQTAFKAMFAFTALFVGAGLSAQQEANEQTRSYDSWYMSEVQQAKQPAVQAEVAVAQADVVVAPEVAGLEQASAITVQPKIATSCTVTSNLTFTSITADCNGFITVVGTANPNAIVTLQEDAGTIFTLVATGTGAFTFRFPTAFGLGLHTINGTATITTPCTTTATGTVTVTLNPSVTITGATSVCLGATLTLTANPTGGQAPYTFLWSGPNNFSATTQSISIPNAQLINSGLYQVTITDSSVARCTATATSCVSVQSCAALVVCKALTCQKNSSHGKQATFTITVRNNGTGVAQGVVATDTLPACLRFVSATGTGWTFQQSSGNRVIATLTSPLAAGASASFSLVTKETSCHGCPKKVTNTVSVVSTGTSAATATLIACLKHKRASRN